jgi:non-specific serine/threonine protein kinase
MKRCPECRRDYYDDSLLYCLDDGSLLLDGPAASDAETAILQRPLQRGTAPRLSVENTSRAGLTVVSGDLLIDSKDLWRGPLIGRREQIAEVSELLGSDSTRLITLTGTGGTGKTRLAVEIARRMRERFPDGVVLVELSALNDPALIIPAIAHALAINETDPRPPFNALVDTLNGRSVLLILDNFEQVIDAGVDVAQLLKAAPELKILVTSREPLRISSEIEYPVPPLALPSPTVGASVAELLQFEAVQLFVERARQARPDFEVTDETAASVAAICCKLDGLPLALELAAARARILSPPEILSRLEKRLKLLTGGSRDLPGRQQTMRAAIEWSYDLLNEIERDVFARLSVFEGGFSFSEAEAIISVADLLSPSDAGDENIELLDVVTSLNEKSLLLAEKPTAGNRRFRMLEVVRDFASELLVERGDAAAVHRLHADYFLGLAEEAGPHLRSAGSPEWFKRLETEHDNIRAAVRWGLQNDPETAARIAASMRFLWVTHGHIREGKHWLEEILNRSADLSPALRWELLTGLGNMNQFQGYLETAGEIYLQSLDEGRRSNDKRQIAQSLRGIAAVEYIQLSFSSAREWVNEALEVSRSTGDEFGAAASLARLGDIALAEGNASESRRWTGESLDIFRRLGYQQGIASKAGNLGAAEYLDGDIASARLHMRECLDTTLAIGDEIDTRNVFDGFAALALNQGDLANAARLAGAAETRGEVIGYTLEPAELHFRDIYLGEIRSAMTEQDFAEAYADGRKLPVAEAVDLAKTISSQVAAGQKLQ